MLGAVFGIKQGFSKDFISKLKIAEVMHVISASVMGVIAFSSQILGRQSQGFYVLFLTALCMLFVFPQFLFDIGFQLSFAATLGTLYIPKNFQTPLSDDFLTTFSAQAAILSILWLILARILFGRLL